MAIQHHNLTNFFPFMFLLQPEKVATQPVPVSWYVLSYHAYLELCLTDYSWSYVLMDEHSKHFDLSNFILFV